MTDLLRPPPEGLLRGAALFLDFDGTLVNLAESPGAIEVPGSLTPLLERLSERLGGRLAIVSGRSVADLDGHLGCSGFAVSGSHGLELRFADGNSLPVAAPEGLDHARGEFARLAAADPRLLVEEKPASIALHYRRAPERAGEAEALVRSLAEEAGLAVQPGKMVMEIRPRGSDKGDALRRLMREQPFAGARPLFVGDDLTDEHAFAAAAALGGGGILVGPPRPTAATWRLDGVADITAWLSAEAAGV
ncbi:MAG TPA: trehalose-phosphatase [Allosphingosinicella sp.]|jgi:trehalose 6-phosphate phosphatase|nr:trehalose-phosphatase [Allosphingosinicella sp.]